MRSPPRALLIDAMGTLVHLDAPALRLVQALRSQLGVTVTEAQAATALRAEIAHYRAHMDEARDGERLRSLREDCARVLADALPAAPRLAAADPPALTAVLLGALRFFAFPDARGALVRARRAGFRVIVVSNWDVSLPDALEQAGLAPLLDGVLTSAAVGARKPAPEIFATAMALAGAPPAHCLHVGDSRDEDVAGALAAGATATWLRREGAPVPGDLPTGARVITTLDDLQLPDDRRPAA